MIFKYLIKQNVARSQFFFVGWFFSVESRSFIIIYTMDIGILARSRNDESVHNNSPSCRIRFLLAHRSRTRRFYFSRTSYPSYTDSHLPCNGGKSKTRSLIRKEMIKSNLVQNFINNNIFNCLYTYDKEIRLYRDEHRSQTCHCIHRQDDDVV